MLEFFLIPLVVSIVAGVIVNRICKWLDDRKN